MPRNNNKNKNKNKSSSHQVAQDMFNNLMNSNHPTPNINTNSPSGSSSGFAQSNNQSQSHPSAFTDYEPIITNPYSQKFYQQHPQQAYYPMQQYTQQPMFSQPPPFYTNLMNQHSFPPFQQTPPECQDSSDEADEAVPETQPETQPDSTTPEPETQPESQPDPHGKRKQVRWTEDETRILCERWIHCSENGIIGRNQTEKSFWNQVVIDYNALTNNKRNYSQLNGKWNKIAPDVKKFNALHKHYSEVRPQSGASDYDVLVATRNHFAQQENGRKFIYEACWNILKQYPKFFQEQGIMGNKRAFVPPPPPIDVDEETGPYVQPGTINLAVNMQNLFQADPLRRPPGRKASKKSSSSDAATSSRSNSSSKSEAYEAVKMTALAQNEAIQTIKENSKKKLAYKALNFLAKLKKKSKPEKELLRAARLNVVQEFAPMYGLNQAGPSNELEPEDDDDEKTESESE